jgi:hypothetical protein
MDAGRRGLGALVAEAMSAEELSALSPRLYSALWPVSTQTQGLWDWEDAWFSARLPLPGPGVRVFVGGAGAGRESLPLRARGYQVDALEPAAALCAALARALGDEALALCATYEDVSRALLDGAGGPAAPLVGRRYDAVILGWGSLTHVMSAAERERTLRAAAALTDGPILASFWLREAGPEGGDESSRAHKLGRRIGRGLGRARLSGEPPVGELSAFGHAFAPAELEALAGVVRRRVLWEGHSGGYPHVTLVR